MVYKYYSDLSQEELDRYDMADFHTHQPYMQDRGAYLGVSAPNVNEWIMDIMKDGSPKDDQND